ncbi:MAG: inorganic diphosphatase [Flavobacteriales bacterium]|jgi:inorganic pyrophosphatase|uniref:inorganic diphosphatase n=1 Tax=Candidatus Ulvibacter alkanivorans TaxID=2267620 RepID=UPI000DF1E20F|nr:inorganic diphosphatase [Candidatus Ulvibacter alkanivorans]MCH2489336.1 inorganic diphosphatase [Flavobacteriales bacterium]
MKHFFAFLKHKGWAITLFLLCAVLFQSCSSIADYPTYAKKNTIVHVVVEIPAGTNKKIEYNAASNSFKAPLLDGKQRSIAYLPYIGNYGFIPGTFSNPRTGGDGDALDALVLCERLYSGSVVTAKPIGILKLTDNGERDYKVICIPSEEKLQTITANSFLELSEKYPGMLQIIELWFTNYNPLDPVEIIGWGDETEALSEINKALSEK